MQLVPILSIIVVAVGSGVVSDPVDNPTFAQFRSNDNEEKLTTPNLIKPHACKRV